MNAQILQEAADWLVNMRDGTPDERSRAQFAQWLCKSPEHVRAYLELQSMWRDMAALASRGETSPEALLRNATATGSVIAFEDIAPVQPMDEVSKHARGPGVSLAIAASIVLVCVAAALGWWQFARFAVYATDIGEQRSIKLIDGSIIELNARSRLKIIYSERERKVELLEGQGLFRVAKEAQRPFVVYSGDVRVRALGTQFDVHQKAGGTIVTVLEGSVEVSAPPARQPSGTPGGLVAHVSPQATATSLELRAGQQVEVAASGLEQPTVANLESATAWTHRQIVFDSAPLTDVAREFNRYNHRQLRIDDPALGHVFITGVFSSSDSTSLLRFLREQPDLAVEESETEVRITARQ
jgi:transmembrane sensor